MNKKPKKLEEKYEALFEASPYGVAYVDSGGIIREVNQKACELLECSKDELIGMSLVEQPFYEGEDREKFLDRAEKVFEGEDLGPETYELETKNGKKRYIEMNNSVIKEDGEFKGLILVGRDITKLRRTEEKLRKLYEASPDLIYIIDEKGVFQYHNPAIKKKFGYDPEEIIETQFRNAPHLTEESIKKVINLMGGDSSGSVKESIREIEETLGIEGATSEVIEPYELEGKTKDGEIRYLEVINIPQIEGGKFKGVMGIARDITERKEAEEREGFLHSLLRHDLRNKAQVVQGYLELLEDFDLPEDAKEFVSKARRGMNKGIEIIEKVRNLRKAQEEEIKEVRIKSVVEKAVEQTKELAGGRGVKIKTDYPRKEFKVMGGALLNQVFYNIIDNAIQHSGGSKIRIRIETTSDEVICIIEDNGKGIPDENKEKIFERNYTTDDKRGSGLGMFLVKTLLETYEGSIELRDSELGGARFDVHLQKA